MPHRAPGSPGHGPGQYLQGKQIRYYRPTGSADVRQLIDGGFQAFNAGRLSEACHIYADKMLAPGQRHHHRPDGRRRAHPRRARRLRHRADGARPDRLHDQHRRQSLSRPPLRAELLAAPRLALPRRRRALRAGHHPDLRRPLPGDGAARDRRLHPRLPRPLEALRARCRRPRSTSRSARTCSRATRPAPSTRSSPRRRSAACRSTPRRPATVLSA